ncbi:MAG: amidohydrolase family protein [Planctomycetota bacterium]
MLTAIVLAVLVATSDEARTAIRCGALIDGKSDAPMAPCVVLVRGNRIEAVGRDLAVPAGCELVDLSDHTVLPGLIDCHTHVLLQGDPTAASYDEQLLKESVPYRTIRAVAAARRALGYGFTTIRDLETEGAGYADADLKRAIASGIVPGPRMFVVTRSLDVTGAYPLLGYSWQLELPHGVQVVDGPWEGRKAVREQVAFGADWIKVYCDRKYTIATDGHVSSTPTFTLEELKAIVDEAHRLGRRVAAHAIGRPGIVNALDAGVDSIEHGQGLDDVTIPRLVEQGVYWCPTILVGLYVAEPRAAEGGTIWRELPAKHREAFAKALRAHVRIAFGTDAGGFPWSENPAQEFAHLVRYGMTPMQAIRSATVVAAELLQQSSDLGTIEPGKLADLVATKTDPLTDIAALEHIDWVMKDGRVQAR